MEFDIGSYEYTPHLQVKLLPFKSIVPSYVSLMLKFISVRFLTALWTSTPTLGFEKFIICYEGFLKSLLRKNKNYKIIIKYVYQAKYT